MNNSGYFDKILFRNSENSFGTVPVLKYQYTEINRARQLCWPKRKLQKSKGNKYPNGNSYDMQFGTANNSSGYATPLSVGDQFYQQYINPNTPSSSACPREKSILKCFVPFSLVMLELLTLGHMMPLLLNFEATFLRNLEGLHVLLSRSGWLEVNKALVRLTTTVAFLLDFRLLQLSRPSKSADKAGQLGLWSAEKNSIDNALASSFYIRTTSLQLLPNACKIFYPTDSDYASDICEIVVSSVCLLLAAIIFLQQLFGGCSNDPKKRIEGPEYEKVPSVSET
ncbi:hypothetical protein WN944_001590 [Citrus x changshan-huyou]|uniref:RING-type E3 ubiquitin transferase n=1 Tax=Citrus x changshan-huyou TaxID=2935761 RepID=A0AAP0ML69_9ROSI